MLSTATIGTLLPDGGCDAYRITRAWADGVTPAAAHGAPATSGPTLRGTDVADVAEVHDFFTWIGRIGYEDQDFGARTTAPAVTAHDSPGGFA